MRLVDWQRKYNLQLESLHRIFHGCSASIIKSYAAKRIDDSHSLVLQSSRLAFILMLALVTPIILKLITYSDYG